MSLEASQSLVQSQLSTRRHAHWYGTLNVDSIAFREFELRAYFNVKKDQRELGAVSLMIAIILWPVGWIWALLVTVCCGNSLSLAQKRTVSAAVISSIVGILWCGVPSLLIYKVGVDDIRQQVKDHHLSIWEVAGSYLDHFLVLLCMTYCYQVYQVNLNIGKKKQQSRESWERRRNEHGMSVEVPTSEAELITKLSPSAANMGHRRSSAGSIFDEDTELTTMSVTTILEILESMPGWKPSLKAREALDYQAEMFSKSNIFFARIDDMEIEDGLHPIERMMMMYPNFDEEPETVWQRVLVFVRGAWFTMSESWRIALESWRALFCVVAALFRAMLPRLWIMFWFKGRLVPECKDSRSLITIVFLQTFVAWWGLLVLVTAAESRYGKTHETLLLVSALVDPVLRLKCARMLKKHEVANRHKTDKGHGHTAVEHLSKIPLLKLTRSANVRAFARLREYVELSRLSEMSAVREALEVLVTLMVFNSMVMLIERRWHTHILTAGLIANTYDYVIASILVVTVLRDALRINITRRRHVNTLHDSRYRTTMRLVWLEAEREQLKELEDKEKRQNSARSDDTSVDKTALVGNERPKRFNSDESMDIRSPTELACMQLMDGDNLSDCDISIKLQNSMLNHFQANDRLDHPLFGVEMTPCAFVSVLLSIIVGFATLLGLALTGIQVWKP